MSRLRLIASDTASRGTGGYTPALAAGDYVFVSGQGPLDPQTLAIRGKTVAEQTRFTLENVVALVRAAGGQPEDIVRCTCYLAAIERFDEFTEAYEQFFTHQPRPTRTTIGCELSDILVEIDCIAYVPQAED
jgi:2-iminobutanoate/2-iminopropanoate deaminase